ncbi:hypothetical protein BHE74_00032367 [Ensete ventricosum]|nr:hypothetical protein GW17_00052122 [Ensete ventricosum]RWW60632.1 hypothetical protein BHE74_00032367 [Ensete ventricosum]
MVAVASLVGPTGSFPLDGWDFEPPSPRRDLCLLDSTFTLLPSRVISSADHLAIALVVHFIVASTRITFRRRW